MKTIFCNSRLTLAAALVAAALAVPSASRAEQDAVPNAGCTVASLTGVYGASLSGTQYSNNMTLYVAVVGKLVADGKGNITSMSGTASLAGIVLSATGSGTYTMNSDCTGTATITTNVIPTVHISFTLVSKATRALVIGTDKGYVVTGEIDKQ